jgi:hypothetical protein
MLQGFNVLERKTRIKKLRLTVSTQLFNLGFIFDMQIHQRKLSLTDKVQWGGFSVNFHQ